jgi:hypothetical protein
VSEFLNGIGDDRRRKDPKTVAEIMKRVTGERPRMWGTSIVGYGGHHYTYANGREGDWMLSGCSPRKRALTLYIMSGFSEYLSSLKKLGKHTTGKSCLYIKKLDDVDLEVLEKLIERSVEAMKAKNA